MNKTVFEEGIEKGIEKGREIERRSFVRERLEEKFGALPSSVDERLQALSFMELLNLNKAISQARNLMDLGLV